MRGTDAPVPRKKRASCVRGRRRARPMEKYSSDFTFLHWVSLCPASVDATLEKHRWQLELVARGKFLNVRFAELHHQQFLLVTNGAAERLFDVLVGVFRKMALCQSLNTYHLRSARIQSVCDYLDKWCMEGGTGSNRQYLCLTKQHWRAYTRPVAMRWRRVWRLARWIERMHKWLPVFNETAFHPDAIAAKLAAQRFRKRALECAS